MVDHVITKEDTGKFNVVGHFDPVEFNEINQEHIYLVDNITDFKSLTSFFHIMEGELESRTIETHYSMSKDLNDWSPYEVLDSNIEFTLPINEGDKYHVRLRWVRKGNNPDGQLILKGFTLNGLWAQQSESFLNPAVIVLDTIDKDIFYKPPNIYKAFSITDFEVISSDLTDDLQLAIQYRISQDSGRHWTQWEDLTQPNVSTIRINPIRFFMVEYKLTKIGTDEYGTIKIYDLNLLGDFQNVSLDYYKTNLMGIRDCCIGGAVGAEAEWVNGAAHAGVVGTDSTCALPPALRGIIDEDKKSMLFNPYDIGKATQLYSGLSNLAAEVFGHEVEYFVTDPDLNGTDSVFHEHQLKNIVCTDSLKVLVPDNNFPENTIMFNQFDLSLFDTFEIHITKQGFKEVFGVDKRPSKEDFMFFCQMNRMYQVEHAQPFRDFNNSSVYYKVILKKFNKKASVKAVDETIQERIDQLTNNSTLDELMGLEVTRDTERVANKDQHSPLSKEKVRFEINAPIIKELIENASVIINKYNYDMSAIAPDKNAITYRKVDESVAVSDNRSYYAWFKMEEYVVNEVFNFMTNYDFANNKGYQINLENGNFAVQWNTDIYTMPVGDYLTDDTWYCYVVNIDQRQKKISQYLYDRPQGGKGRTNELNLITSNETEMALASFEFEPGEIEMCIKGSFMNLTNIRVFNDILTPEKHNKTLTENIIRDSNYLILADNANRNIRTVNYEYGTEEPKNPKNNLPENGFRVP